MLSSPTDRRAFLCARGALPAADGQVLVDHGVFDLAANQGSYALSLDLSPEADRNYDDKADVLEINGLPPPGSTELLLRADAPPDARLLPTLRLFNLQGAPRRGSGGRGSRLSGVGSVCGSGEGGACAPARACARPRRDPTPLLVRPPICPPPPHSFPPCRPRRFPPGVDLPQRVLGAHAAARQRGQRAAVLPAADRGVWHCAGGLPHHHRRRPGAAGGVRCARCPARLVCCI